MAMIVWSAMAVAVLGGPALGAPPVRGAGDAPVGLDDPAAHVARLEAALDGARSCREQTLHIDQTNAVRPLGSTTLRGRVRARLDHKHWSLLSVRVDDPGNGRVRIDGGDGSPFLFPVVGTVTDREGQPIEAGYSEQLVALLRTEAYTEWLEPRPEGGVLLRRVYRERGGRRDAPRRNQLVAHFSGADVLERIEVVMDLGVRPALLVKVSALEVDLRLDAQGHVVEEQLYVKARMGGLMGLELQRRLWTSEAGPCREARL